MLLSVGTFNLNNLFSRWNFRAEIQPGEVVVESMTFTAGQFEVREFMGRLVNVKPETDTDAIAERINRIDVDVLAIQEVEDLPTLERFNRDNLGGLYPFVTLVEGNDPRLIDIGFLSKFPTEAVTSFRHAVHSSNVDSPVFGRDLLEIDLWNQNRTRRLLKIYNNHLKSKFVPFGQDPVLGAQRADERRRRQAETVARIVDARTRTNSPYIILGDMNDTPTSPPLDPLVNSGLNLVNGLANPIESRPAKADVPPPLGPAWTHRFKPSGQPAQYELLDQIWLSPSLAPRLVESRIDRRTKHGGDGSDHDPAWVVLDL
jgi:endonuclease/exonuclease/phosphatase family metal-dependent hydrolase